MLGIAVYMRKRTTRLTVLGRISTREHRDAARCRIFRMRRIKHCFGTSPGEFFRCFNCGAAPELNIVWGGGYVTRFRVQRCTEVGLIRWGDGVNAREAAVRWMRVCFQCFALFGR